MELRKRFNTTIEKKISLPYLLHLPETYEEGADQPLPLLFFLHGMGERGEDLDKVTLHGPYQRAMSDPNFPFILLSPQCPVTSTWVQELEALSALLDEIIHTYPIDEERIYLSGLSMGGFGTWHFAEMEPDRFAALLPICGGYVPHIGFPERIKALKDVPVWTFHGELDQVVPIHLTEALVKALEEAGGHIRFTRYPDLGHDAWTRTYENPEVYEWLLSHRRSDRKPGRTV